MLVIIAATVLSILVMGIVHASSSVEKIKLHWNEYRCNPIYMPFAGSIRPDVDTAENFAYCTNAMAGHFFGYIIDGINQLFSTAAESLGALADPLVAFREMFTKLRMFMLSFASSTFSKAASSTSVFVHYLIKIRDVLKRFVGEGYIGAFLVNAIVDFIWSFVTLFISILKTFVFALLAISIILALFQPELLVVAIVLASMIAASGF
uniref:Uncharacterized protein n=1 Tax=viral metagenome TaxID=1070528 RepID=A0A6C0F179_9ZZZZ